eukprot:TRINITY_DN417_c0_g1_i6.p1 TRINITY_DN417_c0_g1~~TRINITY_DN417_c0_g1_i6.p1  ORF type:complete len:261 (+),score=30.18 TRINITY_DN417_c0_g1_i6:57-839(+)
MYNRFQDANRKASQYDEQKKHHTEEQKRLLRSQLSEQYHGRVEMWLVNKLQEIQEKGKDAIPTQNYIGYRDHVFRDRDRSREIGDGRITSRRYMTEKERIKALEKECPRETTPYESLRSHEAVFRPRYKSRELGPNWRNGQETNERVRIQNSIDSERVYTPPIKQSSSRSNERGKGPGFSMSIKYPLGEDGVFHHKDYFHQEEADEIHEKPLSRTQTHSLRSTGMSKTRPSTVPGENFIPERSYITAANNLVHTTWGPSV